MKSSNIAYFLNRQVVGDDIEITKFSSLSNIAENSVVFANKFYQNYVALLNERKVLALVGKDYEGKLGCPYIISNNPRLDFVRVVQEFFVKKPEASIHPSAVVEKGALIGNNVSIGPHCHISSESVIGDNTIIQANVTLLNKVTLGTNCYIEPGTVLGGEGFGYEYDEDGVPIHFPHTGDIVIGNNVCIGSNTCIDRGTIDSTIIDDDVKIDNLVHIGHNVHVRKNTLIVAGTVICGGAQIGENCWISPNASLHQKITVGDNAKVGIGAVVLGRVREGQTVFGVPAKKL
jgi:UDP-3-O-[3-hydroxymyristoyl] glucosamine N-acyltransferase